MRPSYEEECVLALHPEYQARMARLVLGGYRFQSTGSQYVTWAVFWHDDQWHYENDRGNRVLTSSSLLMLLDRLERHDKRLSV